MFDKRWILVLIALSLVLVLIPACGGGEDEDNTPTPTATATTTPTATATATATPTTSKGPVKIGGINSWSGAAAMSGTLFGDSVTKLVEKQVADTGGILGGRMLKVVKCDNAGLVASANACAKKLVLQDKVSAFVWGGVSAAEFSAVAEVAEELSVPFVPFSNFSGLEQLKFTVVSSPQAWQLTSFISDMVAGTLKPKTVAFLSMEEPMRMNRIEEQRQALKAAGIETVYSQGFPFGTIDLSPYLTKIKYEDPDVLIINVESEQALVIAKQMMELGGWGDIQVVATSQSLTAARTPGAKGWIVLTPWNPGGDYPASRKFEKDFEAINGRLPTSNHLYFYLSLMTVVEAIKLAGSDDPVAINQAIHSGNLEFDTPMGMAHFTPDGDSGLKYMFVQIQEGGKLIPFKW